MVTGLALAVICFTSYYLIVCEYYNDGIVGRVALSVLSMSAGVGLIQHLQSKLIFDPVSQAIFIGVAVFELRHTYRVLSYQKKIYFPRAFFQRLFDDNT